MNAKKLFLPFLFCSLLGQLIAQETQQSESVTPDFKPTFGLGVGMLGYLGDIGENLDLYSALVSRPGYELRAGTPLNSWLEASLYVMFGQLATSERTNIRNLNFESKITTGGFMFTYNFDQLLKPDRVFEPYISLGFETVEFLSKTDLYDSNGNLYNYWSDGTIRDIDEGAANAENAVIIQRDYSYESDIRELDLDDFGKYDERTFAVPVGIGGKFILGGGFDLRIASTMHFTFSNFIDGITENSIGDRQGSAQNDRFLFTSVSVSYGINLDKKQRKPSPEYLDPEEMDLLVLNEDSDGDGVKDISDDCPGTPNGVQVDAKGCPLDSDGDGVSDYLDQEPNTLPGAAVNSNGVTITDEEFLLAYRMYMDSTGEFAHIERTTVATADVPGAARKNRTYVIQVGSTVEGISQTMISKILSIPDVKTMNSGDTTIYIVGDYEDLPEAIRRELALGESGIEGQVMAKEKGKLIDVSEEADGIRSGMDTDLGIKVDNQAVLRVQIGAFKNPLAQNIFKNVPDLVTLKGDDGLTRYYSGSFKEVNPAAEHKVDMMLNGFMGAFLVAFKNGERITLKEAGATIEENEDLRDDIETPINKDLIRFQVQIGAFVGNVPADVMNVYIELGAVSSIKGDNSTKYYYGSFATKAEAENAKEELVQKGIEDAFVVGSFNGLIITTREAQQLLDL